MNILLWPALWTSDKWIPLTSSDTFSIMNSFVYNFTMSLYTIEARIREWIYHKTCSSQKLFKLKYFCPEYPFPSLTVIISNNDDLSTKILIIHKWEDFAEWLFMLIWKIAHFKSAKAFQCQKLGIPTFLTEIAHLLSLKTLPHPILYHLKTQVYKCLSIHTEEQK